MKYQPKYQLLERFEGKEKDYIKVFDYDDIVQKYGKIDIICVYNIDKNKYHYIQFKYISNENETLIFKKLHYGKYFDIFPENENFKSGSLYIKGIYSVELVNKFLKQGDENI